MLNIYPADSKLCLDTKIHVSNISFVLSKLLWDESMKVSWVHIDCLLRVSIIFQITMHTKNHIRGQHLKRSLIEISEIGITWPPHHTTIDMGIKEVDWLLKAIFVCITYYFWFCSYYCSTFLLMWYIMLVAPFWFIYLLRM